MVSQKVLWGPLRPLQNHLRQHKVWKYKFKLIFSLRPGLGRERSRKLNWEITFMVFFNWNIQISCAGYKNKHIILPKYKIFLWACFFVYLVIAVYTCTSVHQIRQALKIIRIHIHFLHGKLHIELFTYKNDKNSFCIFKRTIN